MIAPSPRLSVKKAWPIATRTVFPLRALKSGVNM